MGTSAYRTSAAPPYPVRRQSLSEVVLAVVGAAAAILLVHSAFHGGPRHDPARSHGVAGSGPGPLSAATSLAVSPRAATAPAEPTPRAVGRRFFSPRRGAPDVGLDLRPVHNEVSPSPPPRAFSAPAHAAAAWVPAPAVDTGYLRPSRPSWGGLHFGKGR